MLTKKPLLQTFSLYFLVVICCFIFFKLFISCCFMPLAREQYSDCFMCWYHHHKRGPKSGLLQFCDGQVVDYTVESKPRLGTTFMMMTFDVDVCDDDDDNKNSVRSCWRLKKRSVKGNFGGETENSFSVFEALTSWGQLQKEPGTIPNGTPISQSEEWNQ